MFLPIANIGNLVLPFVHGFDPYAPIAEDQAIIEYMATNEIALDVTVPASTFWAETYCIGEQGVIGYSSTDPTGARIMTAQDVIDIIQPFIDGGVQVWLEIELAMRPTYDSPAVYPTNNDYINHTNAIYPGTMQSNDPSTVYETTYGAGLDFFENLGSWFQGYSFEYGYDVGVQWLRGINGVRTPTRKKITQQWGCQGWAIQVLPPVYGVTNNTVPMPDPATALPPFPLYATDTPTSDTDHYSNCPDSVQVPTLTTNFGQRIAMCDYMIFEVYSLCFAAWATAAGQWIRNNYPNTGVGILTWFEDFQYGGAHMYDASTPWSYYQYQGSTDWPYDIHIGADPNLDPLAYNPLSLSEQHSRAARVLWEMKKAWGGSSMDVVEQMMGRTYSPNPPYTAQAGKSWQEQFEYLMGLQLDRNVTHLSCSNIATKTGG